MTPNDLRIHATALGFLAVIMHDLPRDKQAQRAVAIAKLIEAFCHETLPEAFDHGHSHYVDSVAVTERLLDSYIAELRDTGSALMAFDRPTLLKMYELLHIRQLRHDQQEFYASGHDDVIANRVLLMAETIMAVEAQS